jgi:hypothetical protein
MLIITAVYIAEADLPITVREEKAAPLTRSTLEDAPRTWVSFHEGKNRVFPFDRDR